MKNYKILIDNPAYEWENATPVGCGNMGAMLYGGVDTERIQINEEHIWSGNYFEAVSPDFREKTEYIRKLLIEGKAAEADEWAEANLDNAFHRVNSYETAGNLLLNLHNENEYTDYKRLLSLNDGIASVEYCTNGIKYKRELFASYPDKIMALKLTADKKAAISFTASYERENAITVHCDNDKMTVNGKTVYGEHEFTVAIKFKPCGGSIICNNDKIIVSNSDSCEIYITINSDSNFYHCWDTLLKTHIDDHRSMMERSDIILGESDESIEILPIRARLSKLRENNSNTDLGLIALYYQFGKYLLIGSSRPGTLPANLQGVWSGYMNAPWNSDYHTNINLQMNYWHAESANISECTMPLFDYINDNLLESGRHTAEVNYKCRGAVLHHLSDIYKFTAPADGLWGLWPMGGAWLCYHMWEHYLYTLDLDFLKNKAYTYIHECTRFFLDYMFEVDGVLTTGPSTSPENRYFSGDKTAYLCLSPTMDIEIISGLLKFYIKTEKLLHIDYAQTDEAVKALSKMPPLKVGKYGQLMEWAEDYDEPEPGHRHISHMFALYPDSSINESVPELFKAAETSLRRRLSNGGGHTGWSCAWLISLFARLQNGDEAYENLIKLLTKSTKDNLFDSHPPFQIDGNFGGCAAIIEMLMQSHNDIISILPAIPKCFSDGSFSSLKARGNVEISAEWKASKVTYIKLKACSDYNFVLKMNGKLNKLSMKANEIIEVSI